MSIPFSTDTEALAEAVAIELDRDGRARVTDLPVGLATEPDLEEAWIFDWDDSLELMIPAHHRAQRAEGPLAHACAGDAQDGGFRLVARFNRDDAGLDAAINQIQELATDGAPVVNEPAPPPPPAPPRSVRAVDAADPEPHEAPARPATADLTDLDAVLAPNNDRTVPSATELATELSLAVKGQNEALGVVAQAVVSHLLKVQPRVPLRLLLVGPSGVGKGETYEALAEALNAIGGNGRDWQTVRLDGNRMREPHAVADLLGSPAGYAGYGDGSSLVQALVTCPRTLILIDEIDKAHPDIITALMGVMDHGWLQLRRPVQGRWSLDCRQSILMFTSNAGAPELVDCMERSDLSGHRLEAMARQVLMAQGMPEWIAGRHGHIAVYRPLPTTALAEIATLEVARSAEQFELELAWVEPDVVAHILRESDAATTGARSLRSLVERLIEPTFAEHLAQLEPPVAGQPQPDRRVVVAGPDPHCVAYATWIASDFDDVDVDLEADLEPERIDDEGIDPDQADIEA